MKNHPVVVPGFGPELESQPDLREIFFLRPRSGYTRLEQIILCSMFRSVFFKSCIM